MIETLKNDVGGIFFAKLILDEKDAVDLLTKMWGELNPQLLHVDNILSELTDRGNCVRTRYSHNELVIYTHGWTKEQDKETMPEIVLRHLERYTKDNNVDNTISPDGENA